MNIIEMLLNYLEVSKCLVILMILLIISVTYLLLRSESFGISHVSHEQVKNNEIVYVIKESDAPKKVEEEKKSINQKKKKKSLR